MPDLPLQVSMGALPLNYAWTPQALATAIAERLTISTGQAYSLFTSGAVLPSSDTGPHFLTTESTWYYFDYDTGDYQPIALNSKSLRYIISATAPSNLDYDIWYRIAEDGTPLDIRKWQAGQWVAFPVDYDDVANKPNLAPIGEGRLWFTTTAPQDFLICNGAAILRGQYADLFGVIGTAFGAGDGSTTFNIPDFRGRAGVGVGSGDATDATAWALAAKRGTEGNTITEGQLPVHSHFIANTATVDGTAADLSASNTLARINESGVDNAYRLKGTGGLPTVGESSEVGSGTVVGNIQPSIGINYIIRYQN